MKVAKDDRSSGEDTGAKPKMSEENSATCSSRGIWKGRLAKQDFFGEPTFLV
jgi:hypothetical protein